VSITSASDVELTVSVSSINDRFEEMTSALNEATKQISELKEYKELYEKDKAEKEKAEKESKRVELIAYAADSGCFTDEEIASESMKTLFDNLDKPAIAVMISDRNIEKIRSSKKTTKETSSKKEPIISTKLPSSDEGEINYRVIMDGFFGK